MVRLISLVLAGTVVAFAIPAITETYNSVTRAIEEVSNVHP